MRAILTTYLGPTNYRPARIKVKAHGLKAKFYSRYDWDNLDGDALHSAACYEYAYSLGWTNHTEPRPCIGWINENTAAHVFAPSKEA